MRHQNGQGRWGLALPGQCVLRFGTIPLMVISHDLSGSFRRADCTRYCEGTLSQVLCTTAFSPRPRGASPG